MLCPCRLSVQLPSGLQYNAAGLTGFVLAALTCAIFIDCAVSSCVLCSRLLLDLDVAGLQQSNVNDDEVRKHHDT